MHFKESVVLLGEISNAIRQADCPGEAIERVMKIVHSHEDDAEQRIKNVELAIGQIGKLAEKVEVLFTPITFYRGKPGEVIETDSQFVPKSAQVPPVSNYAAMINRAYRVQVLSEYKDLVIKQLESECIVPDCQDTHCKKRKTRMKEIENILCGIKE